MAPKTSKTPKAAAVKSAAVAKKSSHKRHKPGGDESSSQKPSKSSKKNPENPFQGPESRDSDQRVMDAFMMKKPLVAGEPSLDSKPVAAEHPPSVQVETPKENTDEKHDGSSEHAAVPAVMCGTIAEEPREVHVRSTECETHSTSPEEASMSKPEVGDVPDSSFASFQFPRGDDISLSGVADHFRSCIAAGFSMTQWRDLLKQFMENSITKEEVEKLVAEGKDHPKIEAYQLAMLGSCGMDQSVFGVESPKDDLEKLVIWLVAGESSENSDPGDAEQVHQEVEGTTKASLGILGFPCFPKNITYSVGHRPTESSQENRIF